MTMACNKDTRMNFVAWYKGVFCFTASAAIALYDVQMLKDKETLSKLDNNSVANICKAVSKDTGQTVAKLAATRLTLLCFWIKHQDQTLRSVGMTARLLVWTMITMINTHRMQKRDEAVWAYENKEPGYISITLNTSSATKAFENMKNLLTRVRGVTGVPLVYVVRHQLIPKDKDDDPPFGEEDTKYISVDMKATACAPILSNDDDYTQEYDELETNGPFVPSFLADSKKVLSILLAYFGTSSTWQHVKKFAAQQNRHQA
jgi:hypothetical protein